MKRERLPYEPGAVVDFFDEGLTALGALCARTWHDRLEVVAEGKAARFWNADGALHSVELQFAAVGASDVRDAAREVFPACPLTFRLAEALRPVPLALERAVLTAEGAAARPPDVGVVEKLWRHQFPDTVRWRQVASFARDFHFALVALVRCEIQAIDQHWSLHRMALALPGGRRDEGLAHDIDFARLEAAPAGLEWPVPDATGWHALISRALAEDLAGDLAQVTARQEQRMRREVERVDDYFDGYKRELTDRASRGRGAKLKLDERRAAAQAEHARHRADQVARHEIAIVPHIDALLLVAEPAWRAALQVERAHQPPATVTARFVPRARRWEIGR